MFLSLSVGFWRDLPQEGSENIEMAPSPGGIAMAASVASPASGTDRKACQMRISQFDQMISQFRYQFQLFEHVSLLQGFVQAAESITKLGLQNLTICLAAGSNLSFRSWFLLSNLNIEGFGLCVTFLPKVIDPLLVQKICLIEEAGILIDLVLIPKRNLLIDNGRCKLLVVLKDRIGFVHLLDSFWERSHWDTDSTCFKVYVRVFLGRLQIDDHGGVWSWNGSIGELQGNGSGFIQLGQMLHCRRKWIELEHFLVLLRYK